MRFIGSLVENGWRRNLSAAATRVETKRKWGRARRRTRPSRRGRAGAARRPLRLRPGVPERHRAVEHRPARRVVGQVGDEIAVALELDALLRAPRARVRARRTR